MLDEPEKDAGVVTRQDVRLDAGLHSDNPAALQGSQDKTRSTASMALCTHRVLHTKSEYAGKAPEDTDRRIVPP